MSDSEDEGDGRRDEAISRDMKKPRLLNEKHDSNSKPSLSSLKNAVGSGAAIPSPLPPEPSPITPSPVEERGTESKSEGEREGGREGGKTDRHTDR